MSSGGWKADSPGARRSAWPRFIDRLNDLYGAEVSDDDKLHFANGIERDAAVKA